jgi:hypothetical protein
MKEVKLMTGRGNRTAVLLIAVFISMVAFRILYSSPLEFEEDSLGKLRAALDIYHSGDWVTILLDHHRARWGVVIPLVFLLHIFPHSYELYYFFPILFSALTVVLAVTLFRRPSGRLVIGVAFLLPILMAIDPMAHVSASQLVTTGFGGFYCVVGLSLCAIYVRRVELPYLVLSAIFLFCAYGSNLTYVAFCAAPVLYFLINKKDPKAIVVFCTTLFCLLMLETFWFNYLSGWSYVGGRIELVAFDGSSNFAPDPHYQDEYSFVDFLARWRLVPKYNFLVLMGFIFGSVIFVSKRARKETPAGVWLAYYACASFCLFITFAVQSLNPLVPILPLLKRYLTPAFPLAIIFFTWLFIVVSQSAGKMRKLIILGFFGSGSLLVFLAGSNFIDCKSEESLYWRDGRMQSIASAGYCKLFRFSKSQIVYPLPSVFALRAQVVYDRFFEDYRRGLVAVYGSDGHTEEECCGEERTPSRLGSFLLLNDLQKEKVEFNKTSDDTFSFSGGLTKRCIWEIGQEKSIGDNYFSCNQFPSN